MKKIAVVTATRAEYGILRPLIQKIIEEKEFGLQLYVTGTHLADKYGNTQTEIEKDGFPVYKKISILEESNDAYSISAAIANALIRFGICFRAEKPDLLIVLGDRTELLGICCAAMNEHIPIVHLHGGELTEGAVDDCVRHAITKMSYLHFPAAEEYRKRIIQMGEQPDRVFNVGALGVENIINVPLLHYEEMCKSVGIPEGKRYVVVTFHPATLEAGTEKAQTDELLAAMESEDYFYLVTKANADAGSDVVNQMLEEFSKTNRNVKMVPSLGSVRYLSAVKYAAFVAGNSSSGIIEAPALGTPTVNIGSRQKGRLLAETVINCEPVKEDIIRAMRAAEKMEHKTSRLYGDGKTSDKIIAVIKKFFENEEITLKKRFYDIHFEVK